MRWKSSSLGQPGCVMTWAAVCLCTAGIFIVPAFPSWGALKPTGLLFLGTGDASWHYRAWEILPPSPYVTSIYHMITLYYSEFQSPWCCTGHVILLLNFCIGRGFSLVVVLLVPQWCHNILHSITITSLLNSDWERKVNFENLSYKQFTFLVAWFLFISMFTVWTGKLFGG